jgi:hypothetical protein
MIKLINILKEIVEGKAIEVPDEEMNKVDDLYKYIHDHLEDLKTKAPQDGNKPLVLPKFKNYFTITPIGQNTISVSAGLYNDPGDFAAGRGTKATDDTTAKIDLAKKHIIINLASFENLDEQYFEELVRHELIHAIDPKTAKKSLYTKTVVGAEKNRKFNANVAKNATEKYTRMFQTPEEFTAHAGTYIGTIKKSLSKIEDPAQKEVYKKLIAKLPQDLKNKDIEAVKQDPQYKETMPWLFATNDDHAFDTNLQVIKSWMNNPDLAKKFLQMVARVA